LDAAPGWCRRIAWRAWRSVSPVAAAMSPSGVPSGKAERSRSIDGIDPSMTHPEQTNTEAATCAIPSGSRSLIVAPGRYLDPAVPVGCCS
jgi:hypothetical protein